MMMMSSSVSKSTTMIITMMMMLLNADYSEAFATRTSSPSSRTFRFQKQASQSTTQLNVFDLSSPALSAIDTFYQTQPYISAFLTCSVKASAADLVAQTRARAAATSSSTTTTSTTETTWTSSHVAQHDDQRHQNDETSFDLKRTLAFLLYGGFYQGMGQEYLYNTIFPSIFGNQATLQSVLMQVGLDTAVLAPFVCLPMVYMLKSGVNGMTLPEGLQKYVAHIREQALLQKYWAIWIPVQCLTFGVIPAHMRIVFVACVSFFWVCLLSTISSTTTTASSSTTTITAMDHEPAPHAPLLSSSSSPRGAVSH